MNSKKLDGAFQRALELGDEVEPATLEYRGVSQWDSIGHITLVAEIEATFDVMFSTEDVVAMSSYQKAIELLKAHGVDDF